MEDQSQEGFHFERLGERACAGRNWGLLYFTYSKAHKDCYSEKSGESLIYYVNKYIDKKKRHETIFVFMF